MCSWGSYVDGLAIFKQSTCNLMQADTKIYI